MTDLQIRARGAAEGSAILMLAGEVDLANADEVERKLRAYVASTTGDVRIDCRALEFIDSSGLRVLVRVDRLLARDARRLVLTRVPTFILRVLQLSGLEPVFAIE